jgi:hypothetical protein
MENQRRSGMKSDFTLFLKTWLLLGAIRLGLRLLPFRIVLKLANRLSAPKRSASASIAAIVWAVEQSAACMPGGAKCLARAIATQMIMQRQGYYPAFRIGVAKAPQGHLEAHAWLEYQGHVIMGNLPDLRRFMPLPFWQDVKL